ncbi:MAG: MSMEG_4193 family putative phosphomutase [Actinomycetota bacterium]
MTTLYLVRHGLTAHTGSRLSGWAPGIHLTEDGVAQARAVAERLEEVPLAAVYSSPIERSLETARVIAESLGLEVRIRRALGEVRYGRWTNRSLKTLTRTKLWASVQRWPSGARFPEGESLREVQARAIAEIERLRDEHAREHICCVSHADVIRVAAAHYLGLHIDLFQRLVVSPGSITVIGIGNEGPKVLAVNVSPSTIPMVK